MSSITAAGGDADTELFRAPPLGPAAYQLPGMGSPQGPRFDPDVHLQLEPPALVKDLSFRDVPYPYTEEEAAVRGHLAYTRPFRILSGGVKFAFLSGKCKE